MMRSARCVSEISAGLSGECAVALFSGPADDFYQLMQADMNLSYMDALSCRTLHLKTSTDLS